MRKALKCNASHSLRQVRGAITSALLAKELETTNHRQRMLWGVVVAELVEAERSLCRRVNGLRGEA